MKEFIVAIDGTAGSGKTTTAKLLAKRLSLLPIDTGAMYRAMTLKILRMNISPSDEERVIKVVQNTEISQREFDGELHTYLDNEDVTDDIRKPEVTTYVSQISLYPAVRKRLVELQRKLAKGKRVVLEGRDIGSVVFPDAHIKVFMDASLRERAKRRQRELEREGIKEDIEKVEEELKKRDIMDTSRDISPLKRVEDAIFVDTTNISIEKQVRIIIDEIESRFGDSDP